MTNQNKLLRKGLLCSVFVISLGYAGNAVASDPVPGDLVAPPVNINIAMFYNEFQDDNVLGGQPGNPHGPNATHSTRIVANITTARYIRTFEVGGYNAGVQVFLPYAAYLGQQQLGINDIGAPVPGLPSLGAGRASLTKTDGFAQPSFGAYIFPISNAATGTYAVIAPWIDPPVSSFNKNNNLNPNQNVWTYEAELGFRTILAGAPTGQNLAIEVWSEAYIYGDNAHSAYVSPAISADNIPASYTLAHDYIDPAIPDTNPVSPASAAAATFREQPTEEIRVYLPYEFAPALRAFIAPGFFQSFGGKQTYKINGVGVVDSGNRTEESQLRLVAATFVSPTLQVLLSGDYDVAAHGTPYNRTVELRLLKFF